MKITLLTPPPLDGKKVADRVAGCAYGLYPVPNVFELTTAAVLEKAGHDVAYLNMPINGPAADRETLEHFLMVDDSDIVAFYTVNLTRDTDREATRLIRKYRGGGVAVVFYGPSPSYNPDEFLIDENTFVIRGEPEETFTELAAAIEKGGSPAGLPGLTSLGPDGKPSHGPFRPLIEDLDALPFPARHLIERDKYFNPKLGVRPFTTLYASRNCSFNCTYCVPCSLSFARELEYRRNHGGNKPPVRVRSAENVIAEFELLKSEGYKSAMFLDDQFIWKPERTINMCRGIAATGIVWGSACRADFISDEVVAAMAAANCKFIDVGVESFDQRILDDVQKNLKVETIEKAIKIIKKHGISCKINVLLGCSPLETPETIAHNRKMVRKLDVDQVMYNIANPFPGTQLYDRAKAEGWFVGGEYVPSDVQKEAIINLPGISGERLVKEVRKANMEFFISPRFIMKNITRFRSPRDLADALKSLRRKLF